MLGAAAVLLIGLGVLGLHVEGRLRPTTLSVPGTPSAQGAALLKAHFGDSAPFAVLLRGPAAAVDRQGPRLVRALREQAKVSTLSPWDGASLSRLRPGPGKALVLVDFHVDTEDAVSDAVPELDRTLRRQIHAPVRATQSGYATLSRAIQSESLSSTEQAELLALPFLLIVLLLVFRSPVAAVIPLCFGAITVIASRGLLYLLAGHVAIDAFALTVATMMGLALGVDYALLIVSRFREELEEGAEPLAAAWSTRRTAGRTTVFAGSTLFVSMAVSIFILPGSLLLSLAGTAILVTAISVAVSILLAPALLLLLGHNVNRWRIGRAPNGEHHTALNRMLGAALRRPAPIAALISAGLLLLAAPALAIKTGPPSAAQLPSSDPARQDADTISDQIGPGWEAPFLMVAATEEGPITSAADLRHLSRFQSLLAVQPGVQEVIGPGQVAKRTAPLARNGRALLGPAGERRLEQIKAFGPKLARAGAGVGQLREGLSNAAAGAGLLGRGSDRAQEGAAQIAAGLQRATGGGDRATEAIDRLSAGAGKLADGQHTARAGSLSLALGLHDLLPQLRKGSLARARELRAELSQRAESDPQLSGAASKATALVLALAAARNSVRSLRTRATRLDAGMTRLADGGSKLADGTQRLAAGAASLGSGLGRLAGGAGQLADGLGRLHGGTEALVSGLEDGYRRSAPLQSGLARAGVKVSAQSGSLAAQRRSLLHASPHLFDSGYFVLSALDGAPTSSRDQVAQTVDLSGGQAATTLIVPRFGFNTPGSEALNRRLGHLSQRFSQKTGLRVGLAGGAAQLTDYNQVTRSHVPLVILAMTIVTFIALVLVLRALLLALLAVLLNLMTVAVAFGVLVLLFHVPAGWPLGGHDYVDAIGAAGIFGIVFGLSVDYAVFLLARMREAYEETGDHRQAISFGLEQTARVITGAAAIMMAVFVVFAAAKISTVSQLGIGLTVAVLLDATVVRIVLLPALMLLIGERVWWLPKPLARVLPKIELHPA
jgi:RND superfamily putative drug exporter